MKKLRVLCLILFAFAGLLRAEDPTGIRIESLTASASPLLTAQKKSGFTSVTGWGGQVEARVRLTDMFSVGLQFGYGQYDLDQTNAVGQWNWVYWTKYYRSYINTEWLGDSVYLDGVKRKTSQLTDEEVTSGRRLIRKDSVYEASLPARQYMNLTTYGLILAAAYPVTDYLSVFGSAGVRMQVYERNLYLDEQWTKRRKADAGVDSGKVIAFQYGFRNYSTTISGEVYGVVVGGGVDLAISELIALRLSGEYTGYWIRENNTADRNFPIEGYYSAALGIVIRY